MEAIRATRRLILLLSMMVAVVLIASATAMAVNVMGTSGNDEITGTESADALYGMLGADAITGLGSRDVITGGDGDDELWGGDREGTGQDGGDAIRGENGNDYIAGGEGPDDALSGGAGSDIILGGPESVGAQDKIYGDEGDDAIDAANDPAHQDLIYCGGGTDEVTADGLDIVAADCETVNRAEQPTDGSAPLLQEQGDPGAEIPPDDAVFPAAGEDPYKIHSMWKFRFLNGDLGWIPLRYGRHTSAGSGFGYRHIKAQRGWGWGVRWNMNRTLRYGTLVRQEGTSRIRRWTGQFGCPWEVVYDVKVPPGYTQEKGIITFYDDKTDPQCPRYGT